MPVPSGKYGRFEYGGLPVPHRQGQKETHGCTATDLVDVVDLPMCGCRKFTGAAWRRRLWWSAEQREKVATPGAVSVSLNPMPSVKNRWDAAMSRDLMTTELAWPNGLNPHLPQRPGVGSLDDGRRVATCDSRVWLIRSAPPTRHRQPRTRPGGRPLPFGRMWRVGSVSPASCRFRPESTDRAHRARRLSAC